MLQQNLNKVFRSQSSELSKKLKKLPIATNERITQQKTFEENNYSVIRAKLGKCLIPQSSETYQYLMPFFKKV